MTKCFFPALMTSLRMFSIREALILPTAEIPTKCQLQSSGMRVYAHSLLELFHLQLPPASGSIWDDYNSKFPIAQDDRKAMCDASVNLFTVTQRTSTIDPHGPFLYRRSIYREHRRDAISWSYNLHERYRQTISTKQLIPSVARGLVRRRIKRVLKDSGRVGDFLYPAYEQMKSWELVELVLYKFTLAYLKSWLTSSAPSPWSSLFQRMARWRAPWQRKW